MGMAKKTISILLAIIIATSCMAVLSVFSAGAAKSTTENTANDSKIYFEFPEFWRSAPKLSLYLFEIGGDSLIPWGSHQALCKSEGNNVFSYDLKDKNIELKEDTDYGILFYTSQGDKIYDLTFDTTRLGDTVVVTDKVIENSTVPFKGYAAYWKSEINKDPSERKYGPLICINSLAEIIGEVSPLHQPKAQLISRALREYLLVRDPYTDELLNKFTKERNLEICEQLGVTPQEVYDQYAQDYAEKLEQGSQTIPSLDLVAKSLGLKTTEITDTKVYFEFPAEIWKKYNLKINKKNLTNVFAYVSEIYGDAEYKGLPCTNPAWQCYAKDNDPSTLVFYYDFSSKIAQNNNLMIKEDADYTIQFYHNGYETFALTFDTSRLGDTVVVTPALLENPLDSRKTQYAAYWKSEMNKAQKDREYGPALTVIRLGRVVGEKYSKHQPKAQKLSVALHDYLLNKNYTNAFTKEKIAKICDKLGIYAPGVYLLYSEDYAKELEQGLETTPSLKLVAERLGLFPTILKGDIDGNGVFNIYDVTMLQRYLAEMIVLDSNQLAAADFNDDCQVNSYDIIAMQRALIN